MHAAFQVINFIQSSFSKKFNLTSTDKVILINISSFLGDQDTCCISIKTIAEVCHLKIRHLYNRIKYLVEQKLIEIISKPGEKSEYKLNTILMKTSILDEQNRSINDQKVIHNPCTTVHSTHVDPCTVVHNCSEIEQEPLHYNAGVGVGTPALQCTTYALECIPYTELSTGFSRFFANGSFIFNNIYNIYIYNNNNNIIYNINNINNKKLNKKTTQKKRESCEVTDKPTKNPDYLLNKIPDWIDRELWSEFIQSRKSLKSPLTELAQKKLINQLLKFKEDGEDIEQIINNSIMNGWKGLFRQTKGNYYGNNKLPKDSIFGKGGLFEHGYDPELDPFSISFCQAKYDLRQEAMRAPVL